MTQQVLPPNVDALGKPMNELSTFSQDKHKLIIDRYPNVTWWVTDFTFPNLTIAETMIQGPGGMNYDAGGDTMTYTPLSVDFIVDEDFKSYKEILYWMHYLADKTSINHHTGEETFALLFLNTNKNLSKQAFRFFGVKPTDLSGVTVSISLDGSQVLKATATFSLSRMDVIIVG